ncbi:MAG: hypothetical protein HYY92_01090, partial [Parcubacteria group bacterium]|nr:hypothetical protein [Parcubacteria group bacterium]
GVSDSQTKVEKQANVTSAWIMLLSALLGMIIWILADFSYREDILKLDDAPAPSEEKPPAHVMDETNVQSPAPDEKKKGETANGVSESEALPQSVSKPDAAPIVKEEPPIQDTNEPYSDSAALTGIRPEQQMLNLIWMRPVEEVAALLDFDVVPIAVGRPGGKYEVKWVKLGNLRKSLEVHPEWKGKTLYDLIVGQQTAVAATIMAGGEVPPSQT